ncbi:MAG: hypothetical protein WA667_25270 [Candidatus Nitrosopolaris sp.]
MEFRTGGGILLIILWGWAKDSLDVIDKVAEFLKPTFARHPVDTPFLLMK